MLLLFFAVIPYSFSQVINVHVHVYACVCVEPSPHLELSVSLGGWWVQKNLGYWEADESRP